MVAHVVFKWITNYMVALGGLRMVLISGVVAFLLVFQRCMVVLYGFCFYCLVQVFLTVALLFALIVVTCGY